MVALLAAPSVNLEGKDATFLQLREGQTLNGKHAVTVMLAALGLRLTRPQSGERRLVLLPEREEGGPRGGRGEKRRQQERYPISTLFNIFKNVPCLTPSLGRWLVRQLLTNKAHNTAHNYLLAVKQALLALQPSLPPSPSFSSETLQAAFHQPAAMTALLLYCNEKKEEGGREKNGGTALTALTALNHFLVLLKLKLARTEGKEELVVVEGGVESWEEWREEEVEEEESDDGEEEEEGEEDKGKDKDEDEEAGRQQQQQQQQQQQRMRKEQQKRQQQHHLLDFQ